MVELDNRHIKYETQFIDIWLPHQRNIIVDIPGELPEIIYVTAHFDKIDAAPWGTFLGQLTIGLSDVCTSPFCLSDGAIDNGASCAVLIQLAEWFTLHKPKYSLRFVWFGGEEVGLRGSKCHVARLSSEEWDKVILAINLDGAGVTKHGSYIANDLGSMEAILDDTKDWGKLHVQSRLGKGSLFILATSDHASFEGSNLPMTILGGCLFHGLGAVLPRADWLDLYKEAKPTLFLSHWGKPEGLNEWNDWPVAANLFLLPIASWHGMLDSASRIKPRYMYNSFALTRHFIQNVGDKRGRQ